MNPLYFPFTYINNSKAADLCACFKQITVYQTGILDFPDPMQKLYEKGLIDIRTPVTGDESKLKAILREYKAWAELHQKSLLAFLRATEGEKAFTDETFSSQIASQIKKNMVGDQPKAANDFLFNSRLFLSLAQEFDEQQDRIERELLSIDEMEKKLLSDLTDEDEMYFNIKGKDSIEKVYDSGKDKIKERLKAWAYLVLNDKQRPGIFITDSKDAFEYITELNPNLEKIIDLPSVPVLLDPEIIYNWKIMLAKQIEGLLSDSNFRVSKDVNIIPAGYKPIKNVSLKIFMISNISYKEFFQSISVLNINSTQNNIDNDKINKNILIGIVE